MDLQFLGTGSAFQTKLYNTSAFFVEGEKLFLIDCGETVMAQLENLRLLNYVKEIYAVFTHTHSDHIAGIGHLVTVCNTLLEKKLNIIVPSINRFKLHEKIKEIFNIFYIPSNYYTFIDENDMYNIFDTFSSISFIPTEHSPELSGNCFSILFDTKKGIIFYSGDSKNTTNIEKVLKYNFDKIYVDVTLTIKNVHLDLNLLESIVPIEKRKKIFCVHFDSDECINEARKMGFNIATSVACDISNLPFCFKYAFTNEKNLVLSNFGELAFNQIMQKKQDIIHNSNKIYLNLENTKYENIASLGSFILYLYFVLKKKLYVCINNQHTKYNVLRLINIYGVPDDSVIFLYNKL